MTEFDFLNELTSKTNSSLLLDLNNLWVNSKNLNTNIEEELKKLDWNNVKEVHLAGPELKDGFFVDTHGSSIHSEVLNLLKDHKQKIKNIPIIYERDNNIISLENLIHELDTVKETLNE